MQRVFVETTVQVQHLLYSVEDRQKIDQILAQHQALTSTYVWIGDAAHHRTGLSILDQSVADQANYQATANSVIVRRSG